MPSASITYCGHSTIIVETQDGKRIAVDPWFSGNPSCPESLRKPGPFDLIVLTHGHSDHVGSVLDIASEFNSTVCATYELAVLLSKDGVPESQIQFMNKGGTVELPELAVSVTLTHALHSSSYDAKDGNTYYAGEACGAVVRLRSGESIYHAGDTSLFSDMTLIGEIHRPDVALLPIGDRFTMGPREAARAVELINPKRVIPVHYGTFPLLTGTTDDFRNALGKNVSKLTALNPGERCELGA